MASIKKKKLNKVVYIVLVILLVLVVFVFIKNKGTRNEQVDTSNNIPVSTDENTTSEPISSEDNPTMSEPESTDNTPTTSEPQSTEERPITSKPVASDKSVFTTSKGFKGYVKDGITYIDGFIIANKSYSLPKSYSPNGLTQETGDAFNRMVAGAKLDGITIRCQSGFRSYQTQDRLYNNYVNRDGKEAADIYSARPGYSEHQTGLACDICSNDSNACINSNFDNTNEAKWAHNNAYKYGLILRYPKGKSNETGYKYESWHFRYVGVELATKLYNNGDWITLEDYFGITSEYK